MFIQSYNKLKGDKMYTSTFLVESYRENGKPKHRHLANLSNLPQNLLNALKHELKGDTTHPIKDFVFTQGKSCGGLMVIKEVCKRLGITAALGKNKHASLALVQIMARILCQKSRLFIASQWACQQALEEVLGIQKFDEDALYSNLDWLCEHQDELEKKIFQHRHPHKKAHTIYLYDVNHHTLKEHKMNLQLSDIIEIKRKVKCKLLLVYYAMKWATLLAFRYLKETHRILKQ